MAEKTVALTIAGSDSSGAAGVQADLKTFHQLGVYGASALTLVSAQRGGGVDATQTLVPDLVTAQIVSVCAEFSVAAVKIGALGSADNVAATARALHAQPHGPVVLDPVVRTTSGAALLGPGGLEMLVDVLLPCADLFTPNLEEAALLLGRWIESESQLEEAARALLELGPKAVLLKGGHGQGRECADFLCDRQRSTWLRAPRRDTPHTRGTGCTYAAAIAAFLARGVPLFDAVEHAHRFVQRAIEGAPGAGAMGARGPLDHWAEGV